MFKILPTTRMTLVVPGKPSASPCADDASWRLIDLVLSATGFLAATPLAFALWLALSIGRPTCALYLSVCNISGSSYGSPWREARKRNKEMVMAIKLQVLRRNPRVGEPRKIPGT